MDISIALILIGIISLLSFLVYQKNLKLKQVNKELNNIIHKLKNENLTSVDPCLEKDNLLAKTYSIISHDLRSNFNNIKGLSEILARQFDDLPEERRTLGIKTIHNSSIHVNQLIENLLYWGRIQINKIKFSPESITFNHIIREQEFSLKKAISDKNITIENKLSDDIKIYADFDMMGILYRNILSNAIKYCDSKGKISVNYEDKDEYHKFNLSDNGIGIKPEIIGKIFSNNEFFSIEGTNQEKGTGFGLKICKQIIDKHQGSIGAENKETGGANIWFTLPKTIS